MKDTILGKRKRTLSLTRTSESAIGKHSGIKDPNVQIKTYKLGWKKQKLMNRNAKQGEADRTIYDLKPKHLFSGKRGISTTDRR